VSKSKVIAYRTKAMVTIKNRYVSKESIKKGKCVRSVCVFKCVCCSESEISGNLQIYDFVTSVY
jgi:sulfur relay (sulfurtransferase) DsrF/TusC family protein